MTDFQFKILNEEGKKIAQSATLKKGADFANDLSRSLDRIWRKAQEEAFASIGKNIQKEVA